MVTMGSTRSLAATSAGWFREVEKAAVTRRNKKLRERGNNVGSSAGLTIAATTIYGALKMGGRDGRGRLRLTGPFVACDLSATA